jgi:hypothetical protein
MRHKPLPDGSSVMIYTYSFEVKPRALRWIIEPVTKWIFDWQTRRRFTRMHSFLQAHGPEIEQWRRGRGEHA